MTQDRVSLYQGSEKVKYWLEAILENGDSAKQCCKCRVWQEIPKNIFVELVLRQGGLPNCDELHPEATGKFMCSDCAKMTLV